jgi:hypothetical protein
VVDVGDAVDQPDDLPSSVSGSVGPVCVRIPAQTSCVRFNPPRDPIRLLVVSEAAVEALTEGAIVRILAGMSERRVPEIVSEPDRSVRVLVQPQRARNHP